MKTPLSLEPARADYPYPTSPTIKGLQVKQIDDAVALGVGHAALNLSMNTLFRPRPGPGTQEIAREGRTFFVDSDYLARFDARVKALSDCGIVVNLILLNGPNWDGIPIEDALRPALLHPHYDPEGLLSAFNVVTDDGLACFRAFVHLVAARYMRPDQAHGRACGLILGNEVDSAWIWGNAGEMEIDEYVRQYALALREAFVAARAYYARARVYLSLDHLWTIPFDEGHPRRYYRGRDLLEKLAGRCRADGDFDWSIAFHPYPEDLSQPAFWNDKTALDSFETPRITFKNIEILPRYLAQPHLRFDGRLRAIILSEQGFHSDGTPEGEEIQAAAYALAYEKIAALPQIDSFILHAHVDHRDEFGLNLGLWRRDPDAVGPNEPLSPKPIHAVFRDIDGPRQAERLARARAVAAACPS